MKSTPLNSFGEWPKEGRICAIDYGTVRVGLAICDASRTWSGPLETYNRRTEPLDRDYFQFIATREGIVGWVVGLPIHCDGQESQKSKEARDFAEWVHYYTNLPVQFFDERFTSAFAQRLLASSDLTRKKKKKAIDQIAAHLILEGFLEYQRRTQGSDITTTDGKQSEPIIQPLE